MIETIFYFFGALFFLTWFLLLLVVLFFSIKAFRRLVAIENEVKGAVGEAKATISDVRNKVVSFSISVAGIGALLERLIEIKNKAKEKRSGAPKKEKKARKFAEEDF
ncbi:MAG TPA: hypothetical protein PKK37_02110 [Candidatus Pacearchaeota archaeon]|jgi:predicted secreted protein|nr:hypothetical protein [Candidatus Pacearchaeota archaeon]